MMKKDPIENDEVLSQSLPASGSGIDLGFALAIPVVAAHRSSPVQFQEMAAPGSIASLETDL